MRRSWSERVVTFRTSEMEPDARQRLWDLLFQEAIARGADGFSIQSDTSYPSSAPVVGAEPLISYLRSEPPQWRWSLRPPAWALDGESRRWLRVLGTQVFAITLWTKKLWVLRTDLWGRTITFVLPRDGWEGLRLSLAATLGEVLNHSIEKWRSLQPREAGGWAVPKRLRRAVMVVGLVAGVLVGATLGWEAGAPLAFLVGMVVLSLPQHEPTPWDRLIVRTGSLTDPVFGRRLRLGLNLAMIGVVLVLVGGVGVGLSDPGWDWRPLFWVLLSLGGLIALLATAPSAVWLWRRRTRRTGMPTTSQ
jgi:hypothetical protein